MTTKTVFDLAAAMLPVADGDLLIIGQSGALKKVSFSGMLNRNISVESLTAATSIAGATLLTTGQAAIGGVTLDFQPTPDTVSTTETLTADNVRKRILVSTPAAAITLTLPAGVALETVAAVMVDMAFTFTIINTSANAISVAPNTGVTIVGAATVAANTSATYRIRKTALNTFVAYRA